jgi:hypothetical protein
MYLINIILSLGVLVCVHDLILISCTKRLEKQHCTLAPIGHDENGRSVTSPPLKCYSCHMPQPMRQQALVHVLGDVSTQDAHSAHPKGIHSKGTPPPPPSGTTAMSICMWWPPPRLRGTFVCTTLTLVPVHVVTPGMH